MIRGADGSTPEVTVPEAFAARSAKVPSRTAQNCYALRWVQHGGTIWQPWTCRTKAAWKRVLVVDNLPYFVHA